MKMVGVILLLIGLGFALLNVDSISWWSLGLGAAVALSLFAFLSSQQPEVPVSMQEPWKDRFHELQRESSHTISELKQEMEKVQHRQSRADERCQSYQKLVDVHQGEIDQLKADKRHLSELVIQKEKKVSELKMAHLQFDLFEIDQRHWESAYQELKKQLEESHVRLKETQEKLTLLQKEKEAHVQWGDGSDLAAELKHSQQERKRLEAELASLQQLVSDLAQPEEELF